MSDSLPATTVENLYTLYAPRIRGRCCRLLRNPEEAEDVVQEVFMRLMTRGRTFRGDAQWSTWLFRVATNLCLNRIRDQRRRRLSLSIHARDDRAVTSPDDRIASRGALALLMGGLDSSTQQIAVDYYLFAIDQTEIGRRVGLTRVSVNRRLARVRQVAKRLQLNEAPRAAAA